MKLLLPEENNLFIHVNLIRHKHVIAEFQMHFKTISYPQILKKPM